VDLTAPSARRRFWGRWAALAVALLFVALLIYGIAAKGTNDEIDSALSEGRAAAAPAFELEVLERGELPAALDDGLGRPLADGTLAISELLGTPVVLNLWASWCTPCREEAPRLRSGWERFGSRGVAFLGLNIQDLRSDARAFSSELGLTYPSVRDARRGVADDYGATGIPETFFIDPVGRVVGHVIGVVSAAQLAAGIRAAVSGEVAGTATGGRSFDVR
jgi:peroxiredoxin